MSDGKVNVDIDPDLATAATMMQVLNAMLGNLPQNGAARPKTNTVKSH